MAKNSYDFDRYPVNLAVTKARTMQCFSYPKQPGKKAYFISLSPSFSQSFYQNKPLIKNISILPAVTVQSALI